MPSLLWEELAHWTSYTTRARRVERFEEGTPIDVVVLPVLLEVMCLADQGKHLSHLELRLEMATFGNVVYCVNGDLTADRNQSPASFHMAPSTASCIYKWSDAAYIEWV
jgi:hypothetical protein